MKIGDVVQIEKRPGAWVVAERVVSGIPARKIFRVQNVKGEGLQVNEKTCRVLLRPTFGADAEMEYAGTRTLVVEDQGDFVIVRAKVGDRKKLRGDGFINVENNDAPIAKADLVLANIHTILNLVQEKLQ